MSLASSVLKSVMFIRPSPGLKGHVTGPEAQSVPIASGKGGQEWRIDLPAWIGEWPKRFSQYCAPATPRQAFGGHANASAGIQTAAGTLGKP